MAGNSAFATGFDSAGFITAIRETMKMGMPEDPDELLVWHVAPQSTGLPAAPSGAPYGWDQDPAADPEEPDPVEPVESITVSYALEFVTRASSSSFVLEGSLNRPIAIVTLLSDAYALVKDTDYTTIGSSRYSILFHGPVVAMFDVDVHTIYLIAADEA